MKTCLTQIEMMESINAFVNDFTQKLIRQSRSLFVEKRYEEAANLDE